MGKRLVTTINIEQSLVDDVRASGVRNFSKYVEKLVRTDIHNVSKMSGHEEKQLAKLNEELKHWDNEWKEYLKKNKVKA